MKRAPRSRQRHDLYAKYHDYDSEISDLLGECGLDMSFPSSWFPAKVYLALHPVTRSVHSFDALDLGAATDDRFVRISADHAKLSRVRGVPVSR